MKPAKAIPIDLLTKKYIGEEPTWEPDEEYSQVDITGALNWYNTALDKKGVVKIIADSLTDPDQREAFMSVDPVYVPTRLAAFLRMKLRGFPFTEEYRAKQERDIEAIIDSGKKFRQSHDDEVEARKVSKASAVREETSNLIGDIEQQIDLFVKAGYKSRFSMTSWIKGKGIRRDQAKEIGDFYLKYRKELEQVVDKKDAQLVEGYKTHSRGDVRAILKFVVSIIEACGSVAAAEASTEKKARKPRKKKAVSPDKLVARVKYLKEDTDLGLTSIDPKKILGATELYLFNAKARLLQYYKSASTEGFSIKGTSIINYDEKNSMAKKIRKPETIAAMMNQGHKTIAKDFSNIKAKGYPANGRINQHVLIIKSIK